MTACDRSATAKKHDKASPDTQQVVRSKRTEGWAKPLTPYRHGLVDHDLRRFPQAIDLIRLDGDAQKGRIDECAGDQEYGHRRQVAEGIGLDHKSRSGLPEIALQGDRDQVAPLHEAGSSRSPASSSSATSRKAANSASCRSAALIRADWRAHSLANPGARVSGTQIWMGRKPAARKLARRLLTRICELEAIDNLHCVTCNISSARDQSHFSGQRFEMLSKQEAQ
jgi:hypothetical protein